MRVDWDTSGPDNSVLFPPLVVDCLVYVLAATGQSITQSNLPIDGVDTATGYFITIAISNFNIAL